MNGPLGDLRVVEFGSLIAGPMASHLLADFGAEVIKVEAPGAGDTMREFGTNRYKGRPLLWPIHSRNKKLITLDLRRPRGQELARALIAKSDVLVENFRPGTLERWGLGPDVLQEANPALIVARVSGYGQTGPYAQRPGFAVTGEAMSGMRYINGYPGQAPPRAGVSLGDSLAGLCAAFGVVVALHQRGRDGRGQVVDASILESCFAIMESAATEYAKLGVVRQPTGSSIPHAAPSNVYRSRDEKWVIVAANNDNLWPRLCRAIGRTDLLDDPRFATLHLRAVNAAALDEAIGAWCAEHDAAEIDRTMLAHDVVSGPVYTMADVAADPQFAAREMLVEVEDEELGTLVLPGIVPKLSRTPGAIARPASWTMGADNDAVYGELLGLDEAARAALRANGII